MLVTIEQARLHLRSETADDPWLTVWIEVVSAAVISWLKDEWRAYIPEIDSNGEPVTDSNGDWIPAVDSNGPIVNPIVVGAVLVELASQYRYREGEGRDNVVTPDAGYGYVLNKASTAILTGIRRPTVR